MAISNPLRNGSQDSEHESWPIGWRDPRSPMHVPDSIRGYYRSTPADDERRRRSAYRGGKRGVMLPDPQTGRRTDRELDPDRDEDLAILVHVQAVNEALQAAISAKATATTAATDAYHRRCACCHEVRHPRQGTRVRQPYVCEDCVMVIDSLRADAAAEQRLRDGRSRRDAASEYLARSTAQAASA